MKSITNHYEICFEKGEHKGEKYYVNMSVPCQNPMCTCTEILFRVSNDEEFNDSKIQYTFCLDIQRKKLAEKKSTGTDPVNWNFAKAFLAEAGEEDWEYFLHYFRSYKVNLTKNIEDINVLKYDFSLLESDIELNGTMVIYRDIFPHVEDIIVELDKKKYLLLDYYCLKSTCKCRKVFFVFFEIEKNKANEVKGQSDILYDYSKGTWEKGSSFDGILKEMKKQILDIDSMVQKRHKNLRKMFSNFKMEKTPEKQIIPLSKPGRNDPCFCGSGKKYKKCCAP